MSSSVSELVRYSAIQVVIQCVCETVRQCIRTASTLIRRLSVCEGCLSSRASLSRIKWWKISTGATLRTSFGIAKLAACAIDGVLAGVEGVPSISDDRGMC